MQTKIVNIIGKNGRVIWMSTPIERSESPSSLWVIGSFSQDGANVNRAETYRQNLVFELIIFDLREVSQNLLARDSESPQINQKEVDTNIAFRYFVHPRNRKEHAEAATLLADFSDIFMKPPA